MEKYNDYDELKPYSSLTNSLYNNDFNGNIKAAFAKIPIVSTPNSEFRVSENDLLQNFSQFNPPLERITKLYGETLQAINMPLQKEKTTCLKTKLNNKTEAKTRKPKINIILL